MLMTLDSPGTHNEISNMAIAEKIIITQTIKNKNKTKYMSRPIVLMGNPNIPAPIEVPDIKNIAPIILFKIL